MGMPGRSVNTGLYRYSINGQEVTPEIAPNTTTAEFWQYDARIGKRWNVDPKPITSITPYATFGNNPIWIKDPFGDTLKIAGNTNTITDLNSIIKKENRKYFSVSTGGDVSFDRKSFDKLNRREQLILTGDNGFSLVKDLVESNKNFWFSTTPRIRYEETDAQGNSKPNPITKASQTFIDNWLDKYVTVGSRLDNNPIPGISGTPLYVTFTNLANTPRGDEAQVGYGQKPSKVVNINGYQKRFDGEVYMTPGEYYHTNVFNGTTIQVPRPSMVYHELMENYLRVGGSSYKQAHEEAKKVEGNRYGNRQNTGEASYFIMGVSK